MTNVSGTTWVSLLCVLGVLACKNKRADRPAFSATTTEDSALRTVPSPPPGAPAEAATSDDAFVSVVVRVNGNPLPEWVRCRVTVYEADSNVSVRARGECGEYLRFAPGMAEVGVVLSAGTFEARQRTAAQPFAKGAQEIGVDVAWAIGRIRVQRVPQEQVTGCRATLHDTGGQALAGDAETEWVIALAGRARARFACRDDKGVPFVVESEVDVVADKDTTVTINVTAPVAETLIQKQLPGLPANVPGQAAPSSSEQFPLTREYKEVPETKGTDLPLPKEPALAPPKEPALAVPPGTELPEPKRENP